MTALPVIADVYRVALKWTTAAAPYAVNVLHVHAPTLTAAQVATLFDTSAAQNLWALTSGNAIVTQLSVTKLDGTTATYTLTTSGTKWTGGGGTLDYSPATTQVVSLRTANRGRSYRGRIYLPFVSEVSMAQGVAAVSLTVQSTAWSTFLTALQTGNAPLVVASYKLALWTAVTAASPEATLATQRRRQSRLR